MIRIVAGAAERLQQFLEAQHYDPQQTQLRSDYWANPFPRYVEWQATIAGLDVGLRLAYSLLLLGEPIEQPMAEQAWGAPIVHDLLACGIVASDQQGRLVTNGYSIISYQQRYFVVSLHASYPRATSTDSPVYVGPDSYNLARALPRRSQFGKVLDLCAGSGLCAILLADRADQVVATELNEEAVAVAHFNIALNRLQDRVQFHADSLYQPVTGQRFDLIVANPPFLPVPDNIAHPLAMCGNGGADGFDVLGALLDGINAHLTTDGRAIVYAEGLGIVEGSQDRPFISERLHRLADANQLDITLRLIGRMPIKHVLRLKSISLARQGPAAVAELPQWRALYEQSGATHSYNFLIELQHGTGNVALATERRRADAEPAFATGKGTYVEMPVAI